MQNLGGYSNHKRLKYLVKNEYTCKCEDKIRYTCSCDICLVRVVHGVRHGFKIGGAKTNIELESEPKFNINL